MNNSEKVNEYLHCKKNYICDDCLSRILEIRPRQQINQICNKLMKKGLLIRMHGECNVCKSIKIVNNFNKDSFKNEKIEKNKSVNPLKSNINIEEYKQFKFIEVTINFIDIDINNKFLDYKKYLLKEVILKSKYCNIQSYIDTKYEKYFDYNLSDFLLELKEKNNSDYKLFLNAYGDLKYCRFKILGNDLINSKGIYMYKVNNKIVYIGRCLDNFERRINNGYANISPKNCYLDGQSTNCRINNLINKNRYNIKLYISKLDNDEIIKKLELKLIKEYKPEWNIQGI